MLLARENLIELKITWYLLSIHGRPPNLQLSHVFEWCAHTRFCTLLTVASG